MSTQIASHFSGHTTSPGSEFLYSRDATLLSCTDTNSYVTYANAAFLDVSGFERDQILGRPHNVVRHPEMPKQAFADMWTTIQAGDAWTALVKNRRVDGDYYWVRANVTPIRKDGVVTGYMSVRTCPSREEVAAADHLYHRFKSEKANGLAFYKGLIVRTGLLAWMRLPQILSVRGCFRLGMSLVALTSVIDWQLGGASLWGSLLPALVALLVEVWFERRIAGPLKVILEQAKWVASGQSPANRHLNRVDEIGLILRAVNQAGLNLRSLLDDVSVQMTGMQAANEQIIDGNRSAQERAKHMQANLQETAASAEQMAVAVDHSAQSARSAYKLAMEASAAAEAGGGIVRQVVETMEGIAQLSSKITEINSLIDSIAFQTNILSLNAAVEAARAGESGRGFAVVASEVRALAHRSAQAAKDIKQLIAESVEKTEQGTIQAQQAWQAVEKILNDARHASSFMSEISGGASEQSQGVAQVSRAVHVLDEMAQQNAVVATQAGQALRDSASRMSVLAEAMAIFQHH